mgnify:CR=1 FL=1
MPTLSDNAFAIYNPDTGMKETPMERIESLINFVESVPGFNSISVYDRRLILLERYLTNYMGFSFNEGDPIGKLLDATKKENYRNNSRMNLRLDQYQANEIKETFGFNLTEFLELPTYFMEDILTKQRKILKERREAAERDKREAARKMNGMLPPELTQGFHNLNG